MKITSKLCLKYLMKNKRRTFITIIEVILMTVLITTVLTIFSSYQNYRINIARSKGNFDAEFICIKYSDALEVAKDNNVKEVSISYDYGMSKENLYKNNTSFIRIHLLGYDSNKLKNSGIKLISGRIPQTPNEILLSQQEISNISGNKKIGDELELTFEGNTKKYIIVGLAKEILVDNEDSSFSFYNGRDVKLSGITYLNANSLQSDDIVDASVLTYNLKQIYETTENLENNLKLYEIKNISKTLFT